MKIKLDNVEIESEYIDDPKRILKFFSVKDVHPDFSPEFIKYFNKLVAYKDFEWGYIDLIINGITIKDALVVVQTEKEKIKNE
jgi:hypothetical protein